TRVPLAELGSFEAYIAGQDGVWTVREQDGKLVATEVGGTHTLTVAPSQVEPTIVKANIDAMFSDGSTQHGVGDMDVHRTVLRRAREQAGLDVHGEGPHDAPGSVLDPRRGLGSADASSVKVTTSAEMLAGLADHLEQTSGPLDLHWKRLQTEGGDPV